MIEFGSDYHRCDSAFHGEAAIGTLYASRQFYACGRMAMSALVRQNGWKRLWVPAYFCHEIIDAWRADTEVCLYDDYPLEYEDDRIVRTLPYWEGDALLRMDFFGLRARRTNADIPVPVIEDHSHALSSEWALRSDADWCIASLRKSLPLAFGGMLWSPKGHTLPGEPEASDALETLAQERYRAMALKAAYLQAGGGNKAAFREKYIATENGLDRLADIAALDSESAAIVAELDLLRWNGQRQTNLGRITHLPRPVETVSGEEGTEPFSLILLMPDNASRNGLKRFLVENGIYPAILWEIPGNVPFARCRDFGERMLSIHCDARYSAQDIDTMCEIINRYDTNH